jgi:glyoxylase-like metal-dependent hydrolase (beta-lactamase superfamily II)
MSAQAQLVVPGVWMLPFEIGQAYIWDWGDGLTVIDTGVPGSAGAILHAIEILDRRPSDVKEIVLTHYHYDHCGSADELAARTGATVIAHVAEAPVISGAQPQRPPNLVDFERPIAEGVLAQMAPQSLPAAGEPPLSLDALGRAMLAARGTPPVAVGRTVEDGDRTAGGGQIVHFPGHTPGSIALFAPALGVLFTGDSLAFHEGQMIPGVFNVDGAELMRSARTLIEKIGESNIQTACFGHGAPVTQQAGRQIQALAASQ